MAGMQPTYEELEQQLKQTIEEHSRTKDLLKIALDKVAQLEKQINKNSKNSSKPPSTDQIYERIHHFVIDSDFVKYFDETGWRNSGVRHYVWVASTDQASVFQIDRHRNKEAFEKIIGTRKKLCVFAALRLKLVVRRRDCGSSGVNKYSLETCKVACKEQIMQFLPDDAQQREDETDPVFAIRKEEYASIYEELQLIKSLIDDPKKRSVHKQQLCADQDVSESSDDER